MKKFFRTLKEKWAEYLFEMLVILIGVFGAFVLNSWNEERKKDRKLQKLFENVRADLLYDLSELPRRYQGNVIRFEEGMSILGRTYDWNERPGSLARFGMDLGFSNLIITKDSYDELMSYGEAIPEDYRPVLRLLNQVYNRYSSRLPWLQERGMGLIDRYERLTGPYQWHDELSVSYQVDSAAIRFYTTNPEFRNLYRDYCANLAALCDDLGTLAGHNYHLVRMIDEIIGEKTELGSYLPEIRLQPTEADKQALVGTFQGPFTRDSLFFDGDYLVASTIQNFPVTRYYIQQGLDTLVSHPESLQLVLQRDENDAIVGYSLSSPVTRGEFRYVREE